MNFSPSFLKELSTGKKVVAVRIDPDSDPATLMTTLKLQPPASLVMLSGGAGQMSEEVFHRLEEVFAAVGNVLVEANATVIDGGTQSGAAALMGRALGQAKRTAPYIGVLPAHAEVEPGGCKGEGILEPHHSHFVLVEGREWGEEIRIMYGLADYLSGHCPSLALLVNGGNVSLQEVEWNVKQGREIIVLVGSGRLADEIAGAIDHPELEARAQIGAIVQQGQITLFDLDDPIAALVELLKQRLMPSFPIDPPTNLSTDRVNQRRTMPKHDRSGIPEEIPEEKRQEELSSSSPTPLMPTTSTPAMETDLPYEKQLKQDFRNLIDSLPLEERQKAFLRNRWLDQVLWMEGKATICRDRHTKLRLTTIIGSVIVPILVTVSASLGNAQRGWGNWLKASTIVVSGVVAVTSAVDEFFNYGRRWYSYRQTVESLKSQGWQFFQLTGSYFSYTEHKEAFQKFSAQIEEIIQRDVDLYVLQQNSQQTKQQEQLQSDIQTVIKQFQQQPEQTEDPQAAPFEKK